MRRSVVIGIALVICGAAAAAIAYTGGFSRGNGDGPRYRMAEVERGAIASTVSASGTLSAVGTVDVGSQVSGLIKELSADFNSEVKAGQVIARIDPASFQAKVAQAEAELDVAKANVSMQRATVLELDAEIDGSRAGLAEAQEELKRKRALFKKRVVAASAVEKALAARDQAKSKVGGARAKLAKQKAQVVHALAQVKQKAAALTQRRLDLDYTYIRSPVNGVVINRDVAVGQTVAASLQAPVLFTIAQDLTRMQVEVSVDEADIGQVRRGQDVTFTVDSFPSRKFSGRVHQVRKAGKEVSNVITYTVVVMADNADQRLLPGMTANVSVIVGRRGDVMKVANAALRFRPPGKAAKEKSFGRSTGGAGARRAGAEKRLKRMTEKLSLNDEQQTALRVVYRQMGQKIRAMARSGTPRSELRPMIAQLRAATRPKIAALLNASQREKFQIMVAEREVNPVKRGRVWIVGPGGDLQAVDVSYGISDGNLTEIVRGDVAPGQQVVVGIAQDRSSNRRTKPRFGF